MALVFMQSKKDSSEASKSAPCFPTCA